MDKPTRGMIEEYVRTEWQHALMMSGPDGGVGIGADDEAVRTRRIHYAGIARELHTLLKFINGEEIS